MLNHNLQKRNITIGFIVIYMVIIHHIISDDHIIKMDPNNLIISKKMDPNNLNLNQNGTM